MNPAERLRSNDPSQMLEWLRSTMPEEVFDYRLRRYYLACCRRIWRLLPPDAIRLGLEAAERHLEGAATPREVSYWAQLAQDWGYMAEADLYAISTYNSVCDEQELPDESFFSQSGRVQRWVDEITRIPSHKIRKMVRMTGDAVTPPPRRLLENANCFAFSTIYWAVGSGEVRRGIEAYGQFLSPHVLRATVCHPLERSNCC
jgi:hypothetical protein